MASTGLLLPTLIENARKLGWFVARDGEPCQSELSADCTGRSDQNRRIDCGNHPGQSGVTVAQDGISTKRPRLQAVALLFLRPRRRTPMNYTIAAAATAAEVKEDLVRLMRSNFSWGEQADIWYRWGYEQSPYPSNVCWLVETETRERVGFTALMPRRMKVGDTVREVGQAANLNVAAEHRNALAAVKLQRAVVSHVDQSKMALAFGITKNAAAVLCRAGYRDLGGLSRWIKLFRTEHKLARWIPWKWPCRVVASVVDLGLRLRSSETFRRLPAGWQVLFDPLFDERFDDLWRAASANFSVATERTREYLHWRFGSDPQLQYRTLAVQDSDGRLRGSAIFLFPDPEESLPLATIVDLLPADTEALEAVLTALCQQLRREGAVGVQTLYFGSPLMVTTLGRFNFFRRESEYRLLAYLHPMFRDRQTELLDPAGWHVTDAEAKF